jgi:hypothetical protein
MDRLQFTGEKLIDIDTCPSKKMQLLKKLNKIGAAFMKTIASGISPILKPSGMNADAVFNVFAQAGNDKTAHFFNYLP